MEFGGWSSEKTPNFLWSSCDVGGLEPSCASKPLALQGAVTIQRHLRGFLVRIAIRRHRAAVVIQVGWVCL